jgi:serine/threonine protein kinase
MGYRAPELLTEMAPSYNNKVDIWAMGCILFELAVGQKLFYNDYAVWAYSGTDIVVTLDDTFSEQCKEYITMNLKSMLQFDAMSRPSAAEILDSINRYYPSTMEGVTQPERLDEDQVITDQANANATDSGGKKLKKLY